MMPSVEEVVLRRIELPLVAPFTTSFGTQTSREVLLVEVVGSDGTTGWGECVATRLPFYSEETVDGCESLLVGTLLPMLFAADIDHPAGLEALFAPIRRNKMARAALECALWDLYARSNSVSLASALGGTRDEIEVGISIGLQDGDEALLDRVGAAVDAGFRRVKVKVRPGRDVAMVTAVRREFPEVALMVDANSAYTLADADHLRGFDDLELMMIEQPLAHDDIVDHAELARRIRTPICLDESIHGVDDARKALQLGAAALVNIKIGRVGGLTTSVRIHDLCRDAGVPVWCGGMLETGIGRATNIAMTSLPGFVLPGDTAPSANYWTRDLITPEVTMERGIVAVPDGPGLGYEVDRPWILELATRTRTVRADSRTPALVD